CPRLPIGLEPLLIAGIWLCSKGQFYADAQASALATSETDFSAVLPYDRTSHGETESDAAGVRVARAADSIERFEDLLAFARRNSGSLVVDTYDGACGFGA